MDWKEALDELGSVGIYDSEDEANTARDWARQKKQVIEDHIAKLEKQLADLNPLVLDEEKARALIMKMRSRHDDPYVDMEAYPILIDGRAHPEELEAIAWWGRNKPKEQLPWDKEEER